MVNPWRYVGPLDEWVGRYKDLWAGKPMGFRSIEPTGEHKAARLAMINAAMAYNLEPMEMLALMAYTTGQLIALQDQTKVTPQAALALVSSNIELGNQHAVAGLLDTKGSG